VCRKTFTESDWTDTRSGGFSKGAPTLPGKHYLDRKETFTETGFSFCLKHFPARGGKYTWQENRQDEVCERKYRIFRTVSKSFGA